MGNQVTAIEDLTEVYEVATGDQFPLHSDADGATRKVALGVIAAFMQEQLEPLSGLTRQAAAPSASPMTVTVDQSGSLSGQSIRLIVKPTGTMAVGTINLPGSDDAQDGQEILVNTTQAITTLTVAASGLNVTGAPTTLAANGFFRMMYDHSDTTWYRVG